MKRDEVIKETIKLLENLSKLSQSLDDKECCYNKQTKDLIEVFSKEEMIGLKQFRDDLEIQIDDDLTVRDAVLFAVNDYISRME